MAEKDRFRTKGFYVHLSDSEHEMLSDKAKYCGVNRAEYIRDIIANGAIINFSPFDMKGVCTEINKIGNNINQIAKKVNSFSAISVTDFEELKNEYQRLFNLYIERVMGGE